MGGGWRMGPPPGPALQFVLRCSLRRSPWADRFSLVLPSPPGGVLLSEPFSPSRPALRPFTGLSVPAAAAAALAQATIPLVVLSVRPCWKSPGCPGGMVGGRSA